MNLIRKSSCSLKFTTKKKRDELDEVFNEYQIVVNSFIKLLWGRTDLKTYATKEDVEIIETWLSVRMKQCAGKQAIAIIKSQKKKLHKTEPYFNGNSMELDSRFVDIQEGNNTFDIWLKLTSIGNKIKLFIPIKKHKHFNKFTDWKQSKSIRIRRNGFVDFFFEKKVTLKEEGVNIGIDIGINKMIATSQYVVLGDNIKDYIEKINHKQQKSKAWYRAITSLHNYINQEINRFDIHQVKTVVLEDLTGISNGIKNRLRKVIRFLIGHWNHRKIVKRIINKCEINRVEVVFVNPSYTSQLCRRCGHTSKSNRSGEKFKCVKCGFSGDADHLASLNILDRFTQELIVPVANINP